MLALSLTRIGPVLLAGWEKPWVEQIVDRIMKGMLRTTEERAAGVVSCVPAFSPDPSIAARTEYN